MNQRPVRCVIFDMDGVLVDSNPAHFEAFQKMGSLLGVPFTQEMLERTIGMHNNQIFPLWLGKQMTSEEVAALALQKEGFYRELAAGKLRPIPGAVELVKSLYLEGFPLAVGSSGPRANVELAVKTLRLEPYFSALITGDDVRHGKPDPEIFLKAAEKLRADPEECLVIEDAPQGIEAARAAGMRVIAVTSSRPAKWLSQAHLVVESLNELSPARIVAFGQ